MSSFDLLLAEAERLPIEGWDFSRIGGRWRRGHPPWDLHALARELLTHATSALDLGTGGGEFLASLAPLPRRTVATEGYAPNLEVARERLATLGVQVVPIGEDQRIDLPSNAFDVVLARHESFDAREVVRVLKPGGVFATQQVGGDNYQELEHRFGLPSEPAFNQLATLSAFGDELARAGLRVDTLRESRYPDSFADVGALIYFLRAAPWEVPGFSVARFRSVLADIHQQIETSGPWQLVAHRFLAVATRMR